MVNSDSEETLHEVPRGYMVPPEQPHASTNPQPETETEDVEVEEPEEPNEPKEKKAKRATQSSPEYDWTQPHHGGNPSQRCHHHHQKKASHPSHHCPIK